ncbi:MAG: hypothetical protein ABJF10_26480 [Chthoniobacter sp.]|uniref:hypothetical protein n=1 Tax=Chthoniobacter sp. TaxID=2510640 RepID=UPI0032A69DEE
MKHVVTILLLTTALSMAADKKSVTIQTPSGEITFTEGAIPNQKEFHDKVTELTPEERVAIERDSQRVRAYIAAFVSTDRRTGDVLEDLDMAFSAWLKSGKRDAFTSNDVIRIVGCALGSHAIQHLGVALVAEQPLTRSYPFTSVQYRIDDEETDFIVALYRTLEYTMKTTKK